VLERAEPAATGGQFTRVNDLAAEVGQPTLRWVALFTQAMWAMFRGSAERSEELALAALDLGTGTGQPDTMAVFGVQLVGVRWHQGRMGELVELVADVARANPGLHGYRAVHAHRLVESDRADEARALLDAEAQAAFEHPDTFLRYSHLAIWSEVAGQLGDVTAAGLLWPLVGPLAERVAHARRRTGCARDQGSSVTAVATAARRFRRP
jgi:hypothetical protein